MVGSLSMEANSSNNINQEINPAIKKDVVVDVDDGGHLHQHPVNIANGSVVVAVASAASPPINVSSNPSSVPVAGNIGCDNDSRVGNGSPQHDDSNERVHEKRTTAAADDDGDRLSVESSESSSDDVHHVQFQEVKDDDGHRLQFNDSSDDENQPDDISFPSSSGSSSSSSSSSDDADSEYCESRAPDGGYGWVIVMASFMVNLIADGITFSFGVIYVEFVNYFGEGKSKTAWIGSLFAAIPLLSGPFASYLTDRYGCRKVSIVGGILAALGFIISAFIDSIEMLFLTFGILSGFGLSLCYVAAIVIVAYYFEKRRSFATGLSVCGSGIGTFIFPPFMDYLIGEYGWRGTTLILAGLFLNLCVCGAFMRDLEYTKKKKKDRKLSNNRQTRGRVRTNTASSMDSSSQYSQYYPPSVPSTEEFKRLLQIAAHESTIKEDEDDDDDNADQPNDISTKEKRNKLFSSLVSLPTFVKNGEKVPLEVLEGLSTNRHLYAVLVHNYPSLLISSRSISDSGYLNEQQKRHRSPYSVTVTPKYSAQFLPNSKPTSPLLISPSKEEQPATVTTTKEREPVEVKSPADDTSAGTETTAKNKPEKRRSILKKKSESLKRGLAAVSQSNNTWWNKRYAGDYGNESPRLPSAYLRDLKVHRHSLTYRGAMLNINRYRLRASSCPDIYRNSMTTIAEEKDEWYAGLVDLWYTAADMMDFSYFTNISFLLFAISNFLLYTWYDVPYVFVADYAIEQGYSKNNATYIISVIGILNMLGEISYGWAGDRSWLSSRSIYAASMVLCGVFVAMIPLVNSYEGLCVISGGFGLLVSANYSLTSIILVETISLEKFTNAYGLLLLVQGIGNLVGPPIAGWLYDVTGGFKVSFFLAGFFIILSGFLLEIGSLIDWFKNRYGVKPNADSSSIMSCVESNEIVTSKSNCNNHTTYVPRQ